MRLGVDVGGTFTDLLLHDERTQRTYQAKTPSTPQDQSIGVAAGVKLICDKAGISPSEISLILHGTTVATNAVLEGKGARVGLLVTEGFEYTLHLAKAWTPGPLFGWIVMDKPEPLASLADTRGIPERINARGEIVRPLDVAKATDADRGSLLVRHRGAHHFADACLRQSRARAAVARHRSEALSRYSGVAVVRHPAGISRIRPRHHHGDERLCPPDHEALSVAHRGSSERRGRQGAASYRALRRRTDERDGGFRTPGAHGSFRTGRRRYLDGDDRAAHRLQEAARLRHGRHFDRRFGHSRRRADDFALDRGRLFPGQGADARRAQRRRRRRLDRRGLGTDQSRCASARAAPAPSPALWPTVSGGVEPTVSDANVVLGYLPPVLLGGDMALDVAGAKAAIAKVGQAMGLSTEEAAKGIIDIANEVMLGALRVITVQRGLDPRDFGIVAFGGAGPLHANALGGTARLLSGAGAAEPRRAVGVGLSRSRVQERVRADLHPFDRRPRCPRTCGRASRRLAKKPRPGSTSRRSPRATAASAIRSICATSSRASR